MQRRAEDMGSVDRAIVAQHHQREELLRELVATREAARQEPHTAKLILSGDVVPLEGITETAKTTGNKVKSMSLLEPTLEDVFIHYTGRGLRDQAAGEYQYQMPTIMR